MGEYERQYLQTKTDDAWADEGDKEAERGERERGFAKAK